MVERAIYALSRVLLEAAKNKLSPEWFALSLQEFNIPSDIFKVLRDFYTENQSKLKEGSVKLGLSLPKYKDFTWRLDVEISKRMVHRSIKPQFIVNLETQAGEEAQAQLLQVDAANMNKLLSSLEAAAAEYNGVHANRIRRYIS